MLTVHFHDVLDDISLSVRTNLVRNNTQISISAIMGSPTFTMLGTDDKILITKGSRSLSRCCHDKMTLESLLNQFKSGNSLLGCRTYPDK